MADTTNKRPTSRPLEQIASGQKQSVNKPTLQTTLLIFQLWEFASAAWSWQEKDDVVYGYTATDPDAYEVSQVVQLWARTIGSC